MCCGVVCSLHKQTDGQTSAFLFTSQVHQSMISVTVLLTSGYAEPYLLICVKRVAKLPDLTKDLLLSK